MENTTARPRRWRHSLTAITALAALTLTACSADPEPAGFTDPGGPSTVQSSTAATASPAAGGQDQGTAEADAATANSVDPADAVQTLTYDIPSEGIDGTMTVGLHHLTLNGTAMELLITFTPEFQGHEAHNLWELHAKNHSMVAPSLYDRENLKKYSILRLPGGGSWDDGTVWASPQGTVELASGETQAYYANFAAPQDDIDTINVGLPGGGEFNAVPIEDVSQGSGGTEDGA